TSKTPKPTPKGPPKTRRRGRTPSAILSRAPKRGLNPGC
uniref:Uncharacterized protein n=1 Tax=Aegilops tauschii subsp. strangulata TaxID=200361 RepID=A0A452ZNJ9_AEGTS